MNSPFDNPQWILCVSGDRQTALQLRQILRDLRFRAEIADTIDEALQVVARRAPALVLADFQLGDGSGLELIRRLRRNKRTARSPIMLMATTMQAEHYSHRPLVYTPQEWLNKPVDETQLAHAVMRWVGVVVSSTPDLNEPAHEHVHRLPDRGNFAELPFARVLALAGKRGKGKLHVSLRNQWLDIWVNHNRIVALSSSYLPGNSLGELLVRTNRLSPYALSQWCEDIGANNRLGEWLIKQSLINEDELEREIEQHVRDKLSVAFSWRWYNAEWSFAPGEVDDSRQLECDVDLRQIIFDGITHYYDRERLEMIFSKRERLRRALISTTLDVEELPVMARRMLEVADGRSSAVRVRLLSGMEVRRYYQTLYALWVLDLVRFGDPVKSEELETLLDEEMFLDVDASMEHHHRR